MKKEYNLIKGELKQAMADLQNFLRSPQGENAMRVLNIKFGGEILVKGDPYTTHTRIGERNVYDYLIDLKDGDNIE